MPGTVLTIFNCVYKLSGPLGSQGHRQFLESPYPSFRHDFYLIFLNYRWSNQGSRVTLFYCCPYRTNSELKSRAGIQLPSLVRRYVTRTFPQLKKKKKELADYAGSRPADVQLWVQGQLSLHSEVGDNFSCIQQEYVSNLKKKKEKAWFEFKLNIMRTYQTGK